MQRKARFSLHFRVQSKFGEAKVTKKRVQNKINLLIFSKSDNNSRSAGSHHQHRVSLTNGFVVDVNT